VKYDFKDREKTTLIYECQNLRNTNCNVKLFA
jgi:hypothetical protein